MKLTRKHKRLLSNYIEDTFVPHETLRESESQHLEVLLEGLKVYLQSEYPEEHLDILRIYGYISGVTDIYISMDSEDRYTHIELPQILWVPKSVVVPQKSVDEYANNSDRNAICLEVSPERHPTLYKLHAAWREIYQERQEVETTRFAAFRRILEDASTSNQLETVWPGVSLKIDSLTRSGPTATKPSQEDRKLVESLTLKQYQ